MNKFESYKVAKGFKSLLTLTNWANAHRVTIISAHHESWMNTWHALVRYYKNNQPLKCCIKEEQGYLVYSPVPHVNEVKLPKGDKND